MLHWGGQPLLCSRSLYFHPHLPEEATLSANPQSGFDPTSSDLPVYAVQGGGYAILVDGRYVWHAIHGTVIAKIGQPIPADCGVYPANEAARDAVRRKLAKAACDICGSFLCRGDCCENM